LPLFLHFGWRPLISCKMKKKCGRGHSPVRHFCCRSKFSYRVWYVPYIHVFLLMKLSLLTQSHSLTVHSETATTWVSEFWGLQGHDPSQGKSLEGHSAKADENMLRCRSCSSTKGCKCYILDKFNKSSFYQLQEDFYTLGDIESGYTCWI
jgi:hypothetical protein